MIENCVIQKIYMKHKEIQFDYFGGGGNSIWAFDLGKLQTSLPKCRNSPFLLISHVDLF